MSQPEVKNTKKITKKQKAVLDFIEKTIDETGIAPTVRDICEGLGLSSPSTVHVHLKTLEDKGLIHRDPLKSRCITIVGHERKAPSEPEIDEAIGSGSFSNVVTLPVVGNVAAGIPILAEQNVTETIPLPTEIVGDASSFLLKVRGDSMIEIGINDGDFVAVKQQPTANNGDIVVAMVEDGATVKRFFKENGYVRLQPENSSMEPIIVTENVSIVGKVTAVFRRL
ncbi:transcriptional repressor LexA [Slackia equolifaciens]|uniref:LexA repressor n=1 Tax=Slackia equolifaciens TaxID=498718 RepID=A0A3N0B2L4_9ACTN|nr:transcriptional repressor LexA [Slackia equolifaciens]RNL40989.1 transcriptional repressor LexA [Slackia equolifaciens]